MVETFYGVLGVGPDADRETIVQAFRDEAKAHHPDVSDCPDARDRFKRLKSAREVLVDESERARYDRLGHEAYLRQRGDCCGWAVPDATPSAGIAGTPGGTGTSPTSKAAQAYADGGTATGTATTRQGASRASTSEPATGYYTPGQRMNPGSAGSATNGLLSVLQSLGAWVLLDVALILSAFATAGSILSWGSLSVLSLVVAAGLCVAVLATTTLHLAVRAHT